jgi:hypothetical protein
MKVLLFSPYLGKLPVWIDKYLENTKQIEGYEWLILNDKEDFERRVKEYLGLDVDIKLDTCKISDFRPALGILYQDILKGYDFWGHTDLDCVYGNLKKFIPLRELDIFSNDNNAMCGPFSIYRNTESINNLFREHPLWKEILTDEKHNAFDERGMTEVVRKVVAQKRFRMIGRNGQANDKQQHNVELRDGGLYVDDKEEMIYHFKETKRWPII